MPALGRALFILFFGILSSCFAQTNLIVNGDFSNGSTSWNQLGVYGDAQASGAVAAGAYVITIQKPGTEVWHVQFTQPNIKIDSGVFYTFSFDAHASVARTIDADIEMNGGAYASYSGVGTVALTTDAQRFSRMFVMSAHSDTNARVTFNCGKCAGNVTIDNVSLQPVTTPTIKLLSPSGGEQVSNAVPFDVQWVSVAITGKLKLECSTDNGATWHIVSDQIENSGTCRWTVSESFSPWCLLRLSSMDNPAVFDVNAAPFEIIPCAELIRNGFFIDGSSQWNLGVYGGKAAGKVADGRYAIAIDTAAAQAWQVQLSQSGIHLVMGKTYVLSFVASAASPCTVSVNVGMAVSPYVSYMDTTKSAVALAVEAEKTTIEFTMAQPSDTSARVEFNCGRAQTTIYLDKVSLTEKSVVAARSGPGFGVAAAKRSRAMVFTFLHTCRVAPNGVSGALTLFDARGRRITPGRLPFESVREKINRYAHAPGIYFGHGEN